MMQLAHTDNATSRHRQSFRAPWNFGLWAPERDDQPDSQKRGDLFAKRVRGHLTTIPQSGGSLRARRLAGYCGDDELIVSLPESSYCPGESSATIS